MKRELNLTWGIPLMTNHVFLLSCRVMRLTEKPLFKHGVFSLFALWAVLGGGTLHAQSLSGTAGDDTVDSTGANSGNLNGSPFTGITSIDTAAGQDQVNTNAPAILTTTVAQFITNGVTISNVETLVSTDGNLEGSSNDDDFNISGADSGSAGFVDFSGIDRLNGRAGDDTFDFGNGGSLSGTVDGGADFDILDYADKTGSVSISLQDNSATAINGGAANGFANMDGFVGNGTVNTTLTGTGGNDSFIIGASNSSGSNIGVSDLTVNGSGGTDTLNGTSGNNTFNLTGTGAGNVSNVAFSSIENLDARGGTSDNLNISSTGTIVISGDYSDFEEANVNGGNLDLTGSLEATTLTIQSGSAIGGDGTLTGDLVLASGAGFIFDINDTLEVSGSVTLDSLFGVDDLIGLDDTIDNGTYSLISNTVTDFSTLGIENFGSVNAFDLGGGKEAYFVNGSLAVTVVPEPGAGVLLTFGLGVLAWLRGCLKNAE